MLKDLDSALILPAPFQWIKEHWRFEWYHYGALTGGFGNCQSVHSIVMHRIWSRKRDRRTRKTALPVGAVWGATSQPGLPG